MYYLYLDESGDLGHDIHASGTSRYFVITILDLRNQAARKKFEKSVVRTLKNKLHKSSATHSRKQSIELKGTATTLADKKYFYRLVSDTEFNLYTVVLEKSRFINHLQLNKSRVYNFITHLVLKELPLKEASTQVILTLDRSKSKREIHEFNTYLLNQVEARIPPQIPLNIYHDYSHENKPLQAVDLFAWGIYRKYEHSDNQWYDVFMERIVSEEVYPV